MGLELQNVRKRLRSVGLAVGGSAAVLALAGCSSSLNDQFKRIGMVAPASDRAPAMEHLWQGAWIACAVIGVLVWGLMGYAAIKWRRKSGDPAAPKQTKYHLPLELLYTLVPFLIIGVLFFYTVRAQNTVLKEDGKQDHTVNVLGQKWSWTFNYMEKDNAQVGADVYETGTITNYPTLYLPVNQKVKFVINSADVDHSFWIPAFYFKIDAIPGRTNSFEVTPTRIGTFDGKCAELCGTYHSKMLFTVHVVSQEEYYQHLQALKAAGQLGPVTGPVGPTTIPSSKEEGK